MTTLDEMNGLQKKAYDIYMQLDDELEPLPYPRVVELLAEQGESTSKSTVQRWAAKFNWKKYAEDKANAIIAASQETSKDLENAADEASVKHAMMTLEKNAELVNKSHEGLSLWITALLQRDKAGKKITKDEAKLLLMIYRVTSEREDKVYDREKDLRVADKIGKADLLNMLAGTGVEVEEVMDAELLPPTLEEIDMEIE